MVPQPNGTALVDCYDPTVEELAGYLGYREDPSPGLAHRVMCFEYEDEGGDILHIRLFSPERFREATVGTPWELDTVERGADEHHYVAVLVKESA